MIPSIPLGKIIILGTGHRGLWLASELSAKNFDVIWVGMDQKELNPDAGGSPWQVGSAQRFFSIPKSAQEFLEMTFQINTQQGFQILTPTGLIDFSQEFLKPSLESRFSNKAQTLLKEYFAAVDKQDQRLFEAIKNKLSDLPRSDRWILDWMGALSSQKEIDFKSAKPTSLSQYVVNSGGEFDIQQRAVDWLTKKAQKVKIIRGSSVIDIGCDGWTITGIELEELKSFTHCDDLVLSVSSCSVNRQFGEFSRKMKGIYDNCQEPKYFWTQVRFKMQKGARPHGCPQFFSIVMDPLMPLVGDGFALLKWNELELLAWCRVSVQDLKKQSVVDELVLRLKSNLMSLIPSFEESFVEAMILKTDYSSEVDPVIYDKDASFFVGKYKKNLWIAGRETDRALDFVSSIKTEENILGQILNKYRKELKVDRALHSPSYGENLGSSKSV